MRNSILPELKKRIEERFGSEVTYTFQCIPLKRSIQEVTGETLSLSTLKRLMGLVASSHLPRRSTLDIIARYVGYPDFAAFESIAGDGTLTSEFTEVESMEADDMAPGAELILRYNPDRKLNLRYQGDGWFLVLNSRNSKLKDGDLLKIKQVVRGFELYVADVVRDGKSLGAYIGAKQGGLIDLKTK